MRRCVLPHPRLCALTRDVRGQVPTRRVRRGLGVVSVELLGRSAFHLPHVVLHWGSGQQGDGQTTATVAPRRTVRHPSSRLQASSFPPAIETRVPLRVCKNGRRSYLCEASEASVRSVGSGGRQTPHSSLTAIWRLRFSSTGYEWRSFSWGCSVWWTGDLVRRSRSVVGSVRPFVRALPLCPSWGGVSAWLCSVCTRIQSGRWCSFRASSRERPPGRE